MDGTVVVTVVICILFFMNVQIMKPLPPKPTATNTTTATATTPVSNNVQAVKPPLAGNTSANVSVNEGFVDKSPAPYQEISPERMDAIIRKYNKNLPQADVDRIINATEKYCKEKDIDPRFILAVMARESAFNPNAVSPSGAIGLGQIMPFNYKDLGIQNARDIDQNAKGVVYYLKLKLNDWKDNENQVSLALASYLKGTGDIKRAGGKYDTHTESYVNDILRIRSLI
jgi:soluble lytic murein transglycosylase-like protein